jgi:agmatine deiminase
MNLGTQPEAITPNAAGFTMPAEWARHQAVWLAWPCAADLWHENLAPAQHEFIALCEAIADRRGNEFHGEKINLLVPTTSAAQEAKEKLGHLPIEAHLIPFGDIWLRDTAPLFLQGPKGELATARFVFNGWGHKYILPNDKEVSAKIASAAGLREFRIPWVCEGGSLEFDGEGTCLTSRQCLLNANRNGAVSEEQVEEFLIEALGVSKVLWVTDGLINDHTDGHIDTIVRFSAPGVVLCMQAHDENDPNREIMDNLAKELQAMTDAKGRKLKVVRIPSPGAILNEDDELMPASYLNFYIANTTVIVPTYGSAWDARAVAAIAACFPDRRTIGLSARAILSGGGAFHCISQQQPLARAKDSFQ